MRIGITLPPNVADLDRLASVIDDDVDYYEVAPETLWRSDGEGGFVANGFHERFVALKRRTHRPFVAHGVGLTLGSVSPRDAARRAQWHARIQQDHEAFEFEWYSDHLGVTALDGQFAALPLPVPMTGTMADVIHANLQALQRIVPDVGIENSVIYHQLGDMQDEPAFLQSILRSPRMHMILDLHNVFTMAQNVGFDPRDYIDALDLDLVIEIHLSGGTDSDPDWLGSGAVLRLDSHCSQIPEAVWELFAETLPRCLNLRGVTLERMESTLGSGDEQVVREELRRMRVMCESPA